MFGPPIEHALNVTTGPFKQHYRPQAKQHTGAPTCTATHVNKTVKVDKIKYIFIVLVFPTKSVFQYLKKHAVHTIHTLTGQKYFPTKIFPYIFHIRDRPFNLQGRAKQNFFPKHNIRLYDKHSESDHFFSLHQNQNIFFSNVGNQNIFFRKIP